MNDFYINKNLQCNFFYFLKLIPNIFGEGWIFNYWKCKWVVSCFQRKEYKKLYQSLNFSFYKTTYNQDWIKVVEVCNSSLTMAALQYLDSLRNSHPELADWSNTLADLYQRKLWHQLTLKLELFISHAAFQVSLRIY